MREMMAELKLPADPGEDTSLPLGGQLIGRLERLMILMLLLANQPDGIGLLIAAKSILRFSEVPDVEVELIQRAEIDPVGAGEAAHGPVTAAIANAVFDALGVRVYDLPITRERLLAALAAAPDA